MSPLSRATAASFRFWAMFFAVKGDREGRPGRVGVIADSADRKMLELRSRVYMPSHAKWMDIVWQSRICE